MATKWNFDGREFLVGPALVGNQSFWPDLGTYPCSAFGTAIPSHVVTMMVAMKLAMNESLEIFNVKLFILFEDHFFIKFWKILY